MFWTKEDCIKWLPFIQAVAEGKEILMWTCWMEKIDPKKDKQDLYSEKHRYIDDNGTVYASLKETEYKSLGNSIILSFLRNNHIVEDPEMYFKIKE